MHSEILSDRQRELLPFVEQFKRSFYLVGGTAVALHIGHRRSIDFDLFTPTRINKTGIRQKLLLVPNKKHLLFEDTDQIHFVINEVKVTFFQYPYVIAHPIKFDTVISIPTLLSLATMKAFALGRRAKWKDYVDLYFIIKDYFSIEKIAEETDKVFGDLFSEKLFRSQLAFYKDIDYSEEVAYMNGFETDNDTIKAFLIDKALSEI
jgi:hypothetical protein